MANLSRRSLIRGIGAAIIAGHTPPFIRHLVVEDEPVSLNLANLDELFKAYYGPIIKEALYENNL